MHLIFALAADGRVYPDTHDASGSLDKDVVGPLGLVQTLETQLGMLAPRISKAVRISTYLAKLRACGGDRFWASSFSRDPWSTAATLLEWRDTLVGGGWHGTAIGSNRLDDLAAAEAVEPTLPAGLEDRAIALLDVLKTRPGLRIHQLGLADRRDLLPPLWARIVEALESVGVTIFQHEQPELAAEGSDLRIVQRVLSGEPVKPLAGDGTFTMVEADTELIAAEAVAD